jgi:hypothetical protein
MCEDVALNTLKWCDKKEDDWDCISQGPVDTGGGMRCQYTCRNKSTNELRPVFVPMQAQTPVGGATRVCPGADNIARRLNRGTLK